MKPPFGERQPDPIGVGRTASEVQSKTPAFFERCCSSAFDTNPGRFGMSFDMCECWIERERELGPASQVGMYSTPIRRNGERFNKDLALLDDRTGRRTVESAGRWMKDEGWRTDDPSHESRCIMEFVCSEFLLACYDSSGL